MQRTKQQSVYLLSLSCIISWYSLLMRSEEILS